MQKKTAAEGYDFEHIGNMSEEFKQWVARGQGPENVDVWQVRVQLAIAQQLSVISATLKERGE